jgi:hypothetical protein
MYLWWVMHCTHKHKLVKCDDHPFNLYKLEQIRFKKKNTIQRQRYEKRVRRITNKKTTNQVTNQPTNQPTQKPTNQLTNQPNKLTNANKQHTSTKQMNLLKCNRVGRVAEEPIPEPLPLVDLVLQKKGARLEKWCCVLPEVTPPRAPPPKVSRAALIHNTLAEHCHRLRLLCERLAPAQPAVSAGLGPSVVVGSHGRVGTSCAEAFVPVTKQA